MNYLDIALCEANKANKKGEVPIGAVIVLNDKIISRAHNIREKSKNAIHHAEMLAINKACKKLRSWRLDNCEMFVTLEPCVMCAGAILNARIKKVTIGCLDAQNGGVLSKYKILSDGTLNHKTDIQYIESAECKNILQTFFKNIRKK